jgi:hypothetical protein
MEDEILIEARRAIEVQGAALNELRSRTGVLLAAASVSVSFLGAVLKAGAVGLGFLGGLSLVAFVISVGACIRVLMPSPDWIFRTSPRILIQDWIELDRGAASLKLHLAQSLEDHFDCNKVKLDHLYVWFQVAAFALAAEVLLGALRAAS